MASLAPSASSSSSMVRPIPPTASVTAATPSSISFRSPPGFFGRTTGARKDRSSNAIVAAVGDVSADGTAYLAGGAVAVALLGTAFPILFSRKDSCPECDGAGFVRRSAATLRANAARKDQDQIVCRRCNGLGKLGQIDK